ncbi:hypothetical protein F5Y04DRAFT_277206 [Hypomontagnella monticulosa]|nr:hypothetical protein F5Y04DRAFT_277206 [Hypomontagnella monticulosa]
MGPKRVAENYYDDSPRKRRNKQHSGPSKPGWNQMDPNYGQRSAFGDLDAFTTVPAGDSDLDCEDDAEAMAYLKSVRVQASAIPHVLVASKAGPQLPPQLLQPDADQQDNGEENIDRSIYQDGRGDFRGYYHDGAYTAYPPGYFGEDEKEDEEDGEEEGENPELQYDDESSFESSEGGPRNSNSDEIREAYFTSLTNQYLALRQALQRDPPADVLYSLPRSHPTEVGSFGPKHDTFPKWAGRLRGTDPLPAQIAGMHKESIFRLFRVILGGKFLRKNHELRERTSRWIWALLARLPERGELDYQEIGWIRELGKRAVFLMVSLSQADLLKEHYEVGDGSTGSLDGAEVDVDEGLDEELSPEDSYDFDDADADVDNSELHQQQGSNETSSADVSVICGDNNGKADVRISVTQTEGIVVAGESTLNEAEEQSDVEMQIDEEEEEGEVSETPQQQAESTADLETAKMQLLRKLAAAAEQEDIGIDADAEDPTPLTDLEKAAFDALAAEEEDQQKEQLHRAKVNERATLNMILTVAGEFYGQRDLLEFRDPFGGLQIE